MYEDIIFAKPLRLQYTKDIKEAIDIALGYCVTPNLFYLRDIKINNDGTITYGKTIAKITEHGFEKLLRVLGIPLGYSRSIPRDLLLTTILRLQKDMSGQEIAVLTRDNGDIAGVVKTPYDEMSYSDVLSGFDGRDNINSFAISEERLVISLSFPELRVPGVDDYESDQVTEDLLYVNAFISNSILKDTSLSMIAGLYRGIQTNSFAIPYLGKARAQYQTTDHGQRLLHFLDNISCVDTSFVDILAHRFNSVFNKYKLFDNEVIKYWQGVSRICGQSSADTLFKLEEEDRKDLASVIKARNRYNRRAKTLHENLEPNLATDKYAYDVINDISAFAQTLPSISDRVLLEKLSGSIIQSLVLS